MTDQIQPRKKPRQARARATWEAVLEAAAQVLREAGPEALTTNRVAERAGVSVGSLYQYFPSKQAIYAELSRKLRREMTADFAAVLDNPVICAAPMPLLMRAIMDASIRHHARDPELARRLEQIEDDLPLDPEVAAAKAALAARFTQLLQTRGVPRADVATRDMWFLSMGMAHAALAAGEEDFDDLADRMTRAALGYLGETATG